MSSMRNAIQRRNHRERAQPHERAKWGLLEKPKDYKLRAADHKVKKRKLKALRVKATDRNEDEFYFGMMSAQSKGGVKVARRGEENSGGAKVLSGDVVKLMKTQDVGYLRTVLQQTRRERERMEHEVIGGDVGVRMDLPSTGTGRKVYEDDGQDFQAQPSLTQSNENDDLDDWLSNDENETEDEQDEQDLSPEARRTLHKQEVRRRKLQALKDREKDLSTALKEVEDQRARMNGSMGGVNKDGVKFRVRERKR